MGRNGVGDGVLGLYDGSFVGENQSENEALGLGTLLGEGIGDDVCISAELCLMMRVREVESPLLGSSFASASSPSVEAAVAVGTSAPLFFLDSTASIAKPSESNRMARTIDPNMNRYNCFLEGLVLGTAFFFDSSIDIVSFVGESCTSTSTPSSSSSPQPMETFDVIMV